MIFDLIISMFELLISEVSDCRCCFLRKEIFVSSVGCYMLALAFTWSIWAALLLQVMFLSLWGMERLLDEMCISHTDRILGFV